MLQVATTTTRRRRRRQEEEAEEEEEEEEKEEGVNGESSGLKAWRDCVLEDVVEAVEEWPIFPVRGDVSIEGCRTRRA